MYEIPVIRETFYLWKFFLLVTVGGIAFLSFRNLLGERKQQEFTEAFSLYAFLISLGVLLTLIAYFSDWKIVIEHMG